MRERRIEKEIILKGRQVIFICISRFEGKWFKSGARILASELVPCCLVIVFPHSSFLLRLRRNIDWRASSVYNLPYAIPYPCGHFASNLVLRISWFPKILKHVPIS